MEGSAVSVTQVIVQIVSPVVFAALVIYVLLDLKADFREFGRKLDKLAEDHTKLSERIERVHAELSERMARIEGLFEGFTGRQTDST